MKRSSPAALALALTLASCRSSTPLPAPVVDSVAPATGNVDDEVSLSIQGEFYVRAEQGLGGAPSRTDGVFRAWLGETELLEVVRQDASLLTARTPRGLPPGVHDLTVQGPYGKATLGRAYTATAGPGALSVALLVPARVDLGESFTVTARISNPGGQPVEQVVLDAPALSGPGGLDFDAVPPATPLQPKAQQDLLLTARATAPGEVLVRIAAHAVDPVTSAPLAAEATAATLVRGSSSLAGAAETPATVSTGQVFPVALQIANQGTTLARAVVPTLALPEGLRALTLPLAQEVAAGEAARFEWTLEATKAGPWELGFTAKGMAPDDAPVLMPRVPAAVRVQRAAQLAGVLTARPSTVSVGQAVALELAVSNTGEAAAVGVFPGALETIGSGQAHPDGAPPESQDIPGGETRAFALHALASADGVLAFRLGAAGSDGNSGVAVTMPAAESATVVIRHTDLEAQVSASPARVTVGQEIDVELVATNRAAPLLGVSPTLSYRGSGALSALSGPTPAQADLPKGASETFRWTFQALAPGAVTFEGTVAGTETGSGAAVASLAALSGEIRILQRATLVAALTGPAQVHPDDTFDVHLEVTNQGGSDAVAVAPSALVFSGTAPAAVTAGPVPAAAPIAAGASASFRFTVHAKGEGTLTATASASGTDALDGQPVESTPASLSVRVGERAALVATLQGPGLVGPLAEFPVTMTVTNAGIRDALAVAPSPLGASKASVATLLTGPVPASADLAPGESATFAWTYRATAGSLTLSGTAAGTDAVDGLPVVSGLAQASLKVAESEMLFSDPFGDGTPFSFVFGYRGKVWLGPRKDGYGAVRANPDGSGLESATFSFAKDTTAPTTSSNATPPPYPSVGARSCTANTAGCGPDNENGRGLFTAGVLAGEEWLFAGGARSPGTLHYAYLTADPGTALGFSYLDLASLLANQTHAFSAAHVYRGRLYLGLLDDSPKRPFVVSVHAPPVAPGTAYSNGSGAQQLDGDRLPDVGAGAGNNAATLMVDRFADFADRLYVFNNGGCARSTVTDPGPAGPSASDWTSCTPKSPLWNSRNSVTTNRVRDLEPAHRAFPQVATWKGRLYALRNTTAGPQLWACVPGTSGAAADCDGDDWFLVAPNTTGDDRLTQFNSPANAAGALLLATPSSLYVGFNNTTSGLVLFRTRADAPATRGDFEGAGGCAATGHPATCPGFGGNGLGSPVARRIFDSVVLSDTGRSYLYLVAGDGAGPVRVFRVVE